MAPAHNFDTMTTNCRAIGLVVDSCGVIYKECVEVFVEAKASRDRAIGHNFFLDRRHIRRGDVVGRGTDSAIGFRVEHHVGCPAIGGSVFPQLGCPVHWCASAVIAHVALAIRAPVLERVTTFATVRRQIRRASRVAGYAVLCLLPSASEGAVHFVVLPGVAFVAAVARAVPFSTGQEWLRRQGRRVVFHGVTKKLAAGPDTVAVGQGPRHSECPATAAVRLIHDGIRTAVHQSTGVEIVWQRLREGHGQRARQQQDNHRGDLPHDGSHLVYHYSCSGYALPELAIIARRAGGCGRVRAAAMLGAGGQCVHGCGEVESPVESTRVHVDV